jgi:hypothetical protein
MILMTTPPAFAGHKFFVQEYPRLRASDAIVESTIYDNVLLTPKMVEEAILMYPGGENDPNFRREHLLEVISSEDLRLVPEFRADRHTYSGDVWQPMTNPITGDDSHQYIGYISCDHGVTDQSHTICGVLNWVDNVLYVLKEHAANGMSLSDLAAVHNDMQDFLARRCPEIMSIGDLWDQCRVTMQKDHGICWQRPRKANLEDNIGVTRNAFDKDKIMVHSSCPKLIAQLQHGLWEETRATDPVKKFARTDEHHQDGVAALIYLTRRINWGMRPITRPTKKGGQNPKFLL